jgi:hypothetical protein
MARLVGPKFVSLEQRFVSGARCWIWRVMRYDRAANRLEEMDSSGLRHEGRDVFCFGSPEEAFRDLLKFHPELEK